METNICIVDKVSDALRHDDVSHIHSGLTLTLFALRDQFTVKCRQLRCTIKFTFIGAPKYMMRNFKYIIDILDMHGTVSSSISKDFRIKIQTKIG